MKPPHAIPLEKLFIYGTLQQVEVQIATFGRVLAGVSDGLPGYQRRQPAMNDADAAAPGGTAGDSIASHTGAPQDIIAGAVLALSAEELKRADSHEADAYRRQRVLLASGATAWAYVDAQDPPVLSSMLVCRFYASDEWL